MSEMLGFSASTQPTSAIHKMYILYVMILEQIHKILMRCGKFQLRKREKILPTLYLDANVLVSAVVSPNSTVYQAYQKALDTGILFASNQTLAEYENVMLRSKFDRYISLARRQNFLAELRVGKENLLD